MFLESVLVVEYGFVVWLICFGVVVSFVFFVDVLLISFFFYFFVVMLVYNLLMLLKVVVGVV